MGRALALALGELGYALAINHRASPLQAEATKSELESRGVEAIVLKGDVSDDSACQALVEGTVSRFGRLDVLINNAATTEFIPHEALEAVSIDLWDRIFAVNVRAPFQCVRAARPHLEASGKGQVINVSSIAGLSGKGSSIPYCASKAAVINLTQSLARALAPQIRVNAVAPGFIDSQWTRDGLGEGYAAAEGAQRQGAAMGEVARPEDVAEAIVSLLQGSRLVTGQTLVVDGGALLGARG